MTPWLVVVGIIEIREHIEWALEVPVFVTINNNNYCKWNPVYTSSSYI